MEQLLFSLQDGNSFRRISKNMDCLRGTSSFSLCCFTLLIQFQNPSHSDCYSRLPKGAFHLCHILLLFLKEITVCPPYTATIRHESFTSGHLCCNIKYFPHQLRIQSQNHTKILSMQTVTENSHDVGIIQHQLISMNIFFHLFCCKTCIFVTQLPLQTWGLHVSCTEFPAATAQPSAVARQSLELNMQNAENSYNTSLMMRMKT